MSGFYAGLWDAWEFMVERTPTSEPWPRAAAINDLRWWIDRMGDASWWRTRRRGVEPGLPPLRELAQRWKWGKDKVRALVEDVPAWADTETGKLGVSIAAVERLRLRAPQTAPAAASPKQASETDSGRAANADNAGQIRQSEDGEQTERGRESATRDQLRAHDHPSPFTLHPEPEDLNHEIPGPPAPSEPAADPPRPVLVLTPPGDPTPKKTRKASPPPAAAAPNYTPDQREALAAFKAIVSAFAGQPRCEWITRPAEDERWLIELHAEIGDDTDMPEQFAKMRDWLDGELRRKQAGKSSKFPKSHQAFMRNWLKRATADPGPRHGIDRDRDPAYRGVPDGFEPPKEYRHVKFITPADIVDDPNRPF